jgi:hypothetical protein
MKKLIVWAQQPSSIAGIAAIFGTLSALLLQQVSFAQAVPVLLGAVVSIVLPDNTAAKSDTEAFAACVLRHLSNGKEKS